MPDEAAMIAIVVVPLATAVAAFVAGGRCAPAMTVAAGAAQCGLVVALTRAVLRQGPLRYELGGWPAPLGINLYADGIAVLMLIMTAGVGLAVSVYATGYFSAPPGSKPIAARRQAELFWPLWLLLWAALNGLLLSGDIFNMYVALEVVTLAGVGLIGLQGQVTALVAALRYLIAATAGSLFYLLGVSLAYAQYGTLDWQQIGGLAEAGVPASFALALMLVGLALKTALFPLHFWLPAAHASAPAPVSATLSGLVLKGSFFVILRLWFSALGRAAAPHLDELLAALGVAAIVWGSVQAIRQSRVKLMVAYSSVAQVGYLFLVFALASGNTATLAWRGAAYFALAHALAKAAAFLAAGTLMRVAGTDELRQWRGIARREPVTMFAFGLAGVSLMGLPPSGGFIAKWLLLDASIATGRWSLAVAIVVGGLLTATYVFRVVAQSLAADESPAEQVPSPAANVALVPRVMRWTPLALAGAVIVFGVLTTEPIKLLEIGAPAPAREKQP